MKIGRPFLWGSLMVACLAFSSSRPALAQPNVDQAAPAATVEQEKSVKALVAAGVTAYRRKDFERARQSFEKAWAIFPYASVAASLADVEMKLGRYTEAAEHWEYYLANLPPDPDEAKAQLDECRRHAARVQIRVNPADAVVLLDGNRIETTSGGRTIWLEPGQHSLLARSGDRTSLTRTITLSPGRDEDVQLDVPPPEAVARPSVSSPTAPPMVALPQDVHPRRADDTARNVALVTGSAMMVAGLVVGIVYTLRYNSANDARAATVRNLRAEVPSSYGDDMLCVPRMDLPATCAELHQHVVDADGARNWATGGFIAAGVFVAATVATYLLWPVTHEEQAAQRRLTVAPLSAAGAHGAQVRWAF